ncbi:bifunctional DNA primase/polymerase [Sporosarcina jiandibaonis]|uniref:bifunctional DNA primase/polymerase n=1 Tax=Sporosarcina jiandibaonis TaxID=2715535 RepID=UPI001557A56B|nr:bifunctional DNA primase/polymerase [Sporosarcina jiandibaonis]
MTKPLEVPNHIEEPKNEPSQKHKAASYYAHHYKWSVFPVHSIRDGECTCGKNNCSQAGKHPRTMHGLRDATVNQSLINHWWSEWRDANIGIATGRTSGFIVIDIDDGGEESLEQLAEQYGPLPNTVESITGSGGRHILLGFSEGFKGTISNKQAWLPGVDIRGDGGYIVAPPSLHNSGKHYEWELSSRPDEVQIQTMPEWLLNSLVQPEGNKVEKKPNSHWIQIMAGLSEGQGRNPAAASLAGHLFRRYIDPYLVLEIMEMWDQRNNPPLGDELYKVINSIFEKEIKRRNRGGA